MKESGKERLKCVAYESNRAPLRVEFIKGDARRLKDKSQISDVSQSNPWLLIPAFKLQGAPHDLTTLPLAFIAQ